MDTFILHLIALTEQAVFSQQRTIFAKCFLAITNTSFKFYN